MNKCDLIASHFQTFFCGWQAAFMLLNISEGRHGNAWMNLFFLVLAAFFGRLSYNRVKEALP